MKTLTVIVLAIVAGTSGYLIKVPVAPIAQPALAPSGWIHLQKQVLPLFENVCEKSTDPVIIRLAQEFDSNLLAGDFWNPSVIATFQSLKTGKTFLAKGEIFSEYNVEHTNELRIIFDVMRNAKTFDTFYGIAAWSRQNLNCGLYVNLIYMAMENRKDTEKLSLPPPYELLPNYFIRKDIIIQGSSLLAGEEFTPSEGVRDEGNAYTLDANYTANYYDNEDESKLAYFREDIGLNSYYYLKMLKWAPWLNVNVNISSRYGENMYHMIKQLVARYNLERYANGMPEQDDLNWDSMSDVPYDPMLVYSNGNEFIHRTSPVQLPENEDKALIQTIENNFATVVSHMRDAGYNKTQILNHLMEILVTGERSYDTLARHLLGKALSNNGEPTVFGHYMTSLRDPMIWKMYKKIVYLVDNALKMFPPYTKSELYFPGVEVVSVDVKKMLTNLDYFEFDITEALKIGNGDTTFRVKIGQPRLNHKPFVMKLNISSLVTQKGFVKIYLGPKMMPGEFAKKKNLFNLLDSFEINLKSGSNIVSRTSDDTKMFSPDFTSIKTLSKRIEDAQFGLDSLPLATIDSQIEFPKRLIIPKGTPEGLPLQLFVFVAPFMKSTAGGAYLTPNLEFNSAILSPIYPLDLTMEDGILLDLPNALLKDFIVTHKGVSKVNNYGESSSAKSWSGPSSRSMYNNANKSYDYITKKAFDVDSTYQSNNALAPSAKNYYKMQEDDGQLTKNIHGLQMAGYNYYSNQKQPYDYKSKRPQYQTTDYSSKRVDYKTLYQNKETNKSIDIENQKKHLAKQLVNENVDIDKITVVPLLRDTDNVNTPQYIDKQDYNVQNDDSSLPAKRYLLKSSPNDYTTIQKDETDFLSKRPKIVNPGYKKIYKNLWKTYESSIDKNNKSKQVISNEEKSEADSTDEVFKTVPKEVKMFKIIRDDNTLNSEETPNGDDFILIEEIGNMDISKVFSDTSNKPTPIVNSKNKYDTLIFKDVQNIDNGQYFGIYKNTDTEEMFKMEPVTQPSTTSNSNVYKYIMRVDNHDI